MEEVKYCLIEKLQKIFQNEYNQKDLKDLNLISKNLDNSEVWMETCLVKDQFQGYSIYSDKSDESVTPIRLQGCTSSFGSHTHPKNLEKRYKGVSEFSQNDKIFADEKLLDSEDSLSAFCVQGLEDDKIKCRINSKKMTCSDEDIIFEAKIFL